MMIMLLISLYTARIVFNTLGEENYGIYNLVGGIIVFFSFLNGGLANATRRYITAEIGSGTEDSRRQIFNTCVISHMVISVIIFLLAETIGLWFVSTQLNIPGGREMAAIVVYQLSIVTAILGVMQTPFQSAIVAYEKLNIYAYYTIFDVVFKLLIIYFIQVVDFDKLIVYAILMFIAGLVNICICRAYCYWKFSMCKWCFVHNKELFRKVFAFTGWSLFGQAAVVTTNQGVSVLINVFHSVLANAAMGVANTIVNVVNQFVTNFQTAFNPQITKSYVANETNHLVSLVNRTSKLSSFLILIFLLPILFECDTLLTIWLGNYPQYATEFCVLSLGYIYIEAISAPLWMVIYSDTNIKQYQMYISSVYSLNFFLSLLLLWIGMVPYIVMIVRIIVNIALVLVRLIYIKKILPEFDVYNWLWQVLLKGIFIFMMSAIVPMLFVIFVDCNRWIELISVTSLSLIIMLPLIYKVGFDRREQEFISNMILSKLHKNREL